MLFVFYQGCDVGSSQFVTKRIHMHAFPQIIQIKFCYQSPKCQNQTNRLANLMIISVWTVNQRLPPEDF